MSEFDVTPEDLANASGAVIKPAADLATALKAISNAAALAAGTPVAGAYDGLVSTAATDVGTLQTAVDDLAHALKTAAQNRSRAGTRRDRLAVRRTVSGHIGVERPRR